MQVEAPTSAQSALTGCHRPEHRCAVGQWLLPYVTRLSGAWPARAPPRPAGLQAASAGWADARSGTPTPGGGGAGTGIERADRIVVFHRGEVREVRTHEELLGRDGIYARLYRFQFAAPLSAGVKASGARGAAS